MGFIRLIRMMVAADHFHLRSSVGPWLAWETGRRIGRIGLKSFLYFEGMDDPGPGLLGFHRRESVSSWNWI